MILRQTHPIHHCTNSKDRMQAQLNQVENTRNDGTQAAISSLVQQIVTQQTHQKQQHERQVMILENQRLLMQQQRINSGLGGLVYPAFNDVAIGNQNFSKTSNALKDHALSVKRQREAAAPMTNISQAKKIKSVSRSGGKRCHYDDCTKLARSTTLFCAAHGGGRRCQLQGCSKAARGSTQFCIAHGGGRRCGKEGCTKSAQGSTNYCIAHGGGRRCTFEGCKKSARGPTGLCKAHGGGKRCKFAGCWKCAMDISPYCKVHTSDLIEKEHQRTLYQKRIGTSNGLLPIHTSAASRMSLSPLASPLNASAAAPNLNLLPFQNTNMSPRVSPLGRQTHSQAYFNSSSNLANHLQNSAQLGGSFTKNN
mmetsp:Transcript_9493/g.17902  ORF Transcript_9493/g.17902 Transcript_9493/m.17902 type:complete len:365 (+) Transcript_9493:263-1357(+)